MPPPTRRLYDVTDAELPADFVRAWPQITVRLHEGGHGIRPWAQHANAAFVGQWALSLQSSWNDRANRSFFPLVQRIVLQAQEIQTHGVRNVQGATQLAEDLSTAWTAVLETGSRAVEIESVQHHCSAEAALKLGEWLTTTERRVENLRSMPAKAQREISKSYCYIHEFEVSESFSAANPIHKAVCKSVQGTSQCRWVSAIPWQRNGQFNLTNAIYRVAVARRYRMAKPAPAQAPIACKCGVNKGMPGLDSMGDHEEAVCTALQGARTQAHNNLQIS